MTTVKVPPLIRKIVGRAKILGELHHREFLIREQLKGLDAQAREDSNFAKRRPSRMTTSRRAELKRARQDHVEFLVRTRLLEQQELEQIERISREVDGQLKETISDLLERIK